MSEKLFELKKASYSYAGRIGALCEADLSIIEGEQVAVLGANGSGKSTLLKLLDGLIFPTSGEVFAFGKRLSEEALEKNEGNFSSIFRKKVGLVFQNSETQLFCPTVLDEIMFGPLQLGMPQVEMSQRAEEVMELLGLGSLKNRAPYSLSGGEKKKVAIACVLSVNPEVLLLDEPTSGLDPKTQSFLVELLLELKKARKTIIIATHDLELAEVFSERAVVFSEGHRIVADGSANDVLGDTDLLLDVNLIHEHYHKSRGALKKHIHSHPFGHLHKG
jgi:cobalt/nickel transport system ATP-binding protein